MPKPRDFHGETRRAQRLESLPQTPADANGRIRLWPAPYSNRAWEERAGAESSGAHVLFQFRTYCSPGGTPEEKDQNLKTLVPLLTEVISVKLHGFLLEKKIESK